MVEKLLNRPMGPLEQGDQAIVDNLQELPQVENQLYESPGETTILDLTANRETIPGLPKDHWSVAALQTDEAGMPNNSEITLITTSAEGIDAHMHDGSEDSLITVGTDNTVKKGVNEEVQPLNRREANELKLKAAERLSRAVLHKAMVENADISLLSPKAITHAVNTLATEFHNDWRKTRLQDNGSFEPRLKQTNDESWVETHGTDLVDIANTEYSDLPADWQAENKAAAEVVVGIMNERNGDVDLSDPATRNEVGAIIHDAWLSRNDWAKGGELGVPFDQLSETEQAKDLDQVAVAQRAFLK